MEKCVNLSDGTSFPRVYLAQDFFREILRAEPPGFSLSEDHEKTVITLYSDYCAATSWPLRDRIIGARRGTEIRRSKGKKIQTECFLIIFADGSDCSFSFIKACSAISTREA